MVKWLGKQYRTLYTKITTLLKKSSHTEPSNALTEECVRVSEAVRKLIPVLHKDLEMNVAFFVERFLIGQYNILCNEMGGQMSDLYFQKVFFPKILNILQNSVPIIINKMISQNEKAPIVRTIIVPSDMPNSIH